MNNFSSTLVLYPSKFLCFNCEHFSAKTIENLVEITKSKTLVSEVSALQSQEFIVRKLDSILLVVGGDESGVLYGAYRLLTMLTS